MRHQKGGNGRKREDEKRKRKKGKVEGRERREKRKEKQSQVFFKLSFTKYYNYLIFQKIEKEKKKKEWNILKFVLFLV